MRFETKKKRAARLEREKKEERDKKLKTVGEVIKFVIDIIVRLPK